MDQFKKAQLAVDTLACIAAFEKNLSVFTQDEGERGDRDEQVTRISLPALNVVCFQIGAGHHYNREQQAFKDEVAKALAPLLERLKAAARAELAKA